MKTKFIQLTNQNVGAIPAATAAAPEFLPLGTVTRAFTRADKCRDTFVVSTTGANVVTIEDVGQYKVHYDATFVATAAGAVRVALYQNGVEVYALATTAAAAGDVVQLSFDYIVRVFPTCAGVIPQALQIGSSAGAITSGVTNLIVEEL